ncbi:cytidine deaminase-like [Halichondria panicea]|uniref:cytidine deaminase-like n=1 Tax=Halichondria panicea TaxID=6063 RepID=UPI00312BBDD3
MSEVLELTVEETQRLVDACIAAKDNAHAPYSKFRVGAALLTQSGTLYTGCNVENSAYPLTTCAERCAIVKAVSEGDKLFKAIAVSTDIPDKFAPPCGACRQVMAEFGVDYWVVLTKPDKTTDIHRVRDLLPHTFTTDDLRAGQSK